MSNQDITHDFGTEQEVFAALRAREFIQLTITNNYYDYYRIAAQRMAGVHTPQSFYKVYYQLALWDFDEYGIPRYPRSLMRGLGAPIEFRFAFRALFAEQRLRIKQNSSDFFGTLAGVLSRQAVAFALIGMSAIVTGAHFGERNVWWAVLFIWALSIISVIVAELIGIVANQVMQSRRRLKLGNAFTKDLKSED